ncbi:hypothetical protein COCOR_07658 [Corallococcus coralloides DSM 2259]|uniref:Lipoprotein n=1 Tax=Corallococcus coralloides (strain ATCC 25202 / DSM 2259 / NBRC 100086 / M2) TaxID=1144275 RepID=H8MRS7_CORCM|nr:hypothetical protein [Corallococcus coralloides]AFE07664.1 hypothetical protein COCOR_07658 [Corallococcus coralloides DSM 2259]
MKRNSQSLRRGVGVLAVLAGVGGAWASSAQDQIGFSVARTQFNLRITPDNVTGPEFQVSRLPGELRGRVADAPVTLKLEDEKVKGNIGTAVVNLDVKKDGDAVKAKGGFYGRPVNLTLSPQELTVYVRDCTYRLKAKEEGRTYEGKRSCDRSFMPPTVITLPDAFLAASPAEQASLLLLAL